MKLVLPRVASSRTPPVDGAAGGTGGRRIGRARAAARSSVTGVRPILAPILGRAFVASPNARRNFEAGEARRGGTRASGRPAVVWRTESRNVAGWEGSQSNERAGPSRQTGAGPGKHQRSRGGTRPKIRTSGDQEGRTRRGASGLPWGRPGRAGVDAGATRPGAPGRRRFDDHVRLFCPADRDGQHAGLGRTLAGQNPARPAASVGDRTAARTAGSAGSRSLDRPARGSRPGPRNQGELGARPGGQRPAADDSARGRGGPPLADRSVTARFVRARACTAGVGTRERFGLGGRGKAVTGGPPGADLSKPGGARTGRTANPNRQARRAENALVCKSRRKTGSAILLGSRDRGNEDEQRVPSDVGVVTSRRRPHVERGTPSPRRRTGPGPEVGCRSCRRARTRAKFRVRVGVPDGEAGRRFSTPTPAGVLFALGAKPLGRGSQGSGQGRRPRLRRFSGFADHRDLDSGRRRRSMEAPAGPNVAVPLVVTAGSLPGQAAHHLARAGVGPPCGAPAARAQPRSA